MLKSLNFLNQFIIVLFFIWLTPVNLSAQQIKRCSTTEFVRSYISIDPEAQERFKKIEVFTQDWVRMHRNDFTGKKDQELITIPVVVHVVYNTSAQNLSDAQIQSQIDVLNEDYQRLNADASNTPSHFQSVAGNVGIEFVLAKRTPDGKSTNGITRTRTSLTSFKSYSSGGQEEMKYTNKGGINPWPQDKYLNIWICNLSGGSIGYGTPPGVSSLVDGVVIHYKVFGRTGDLMAPFLKGRTTTHEVGHWLNLKHIWGDAYCGNDNVSDTPVQSASNYGCPTGKKISCNNGPNGEMYQNFMDYTDDACMNLFTNGQKMRIHAALNGPRASLKSSDGATPVNVPTIDAGISKVISPVGELCSGSGKPIVELKNYGSQTLNQVVIKYQIGTSSAQSYSWSGQLAGNSSVQVTLPLLSFASGGTFKAFTVSPNNSTDGNAANDESTSQFKIKSAGISVPYAQGFEGNFPPSGWTIGNPDNKVTWAKSSKAGNGDQYSAFLQDFEYEANGQTDELIMPYINLSGVNSLTFDVAYALYETGDHSGKLEVFISTDCGNVFESIYSKEKQELVTAQPTTNEFIPSGSQWRTEVVDLAKYSSYSTGIIKFRFTQDYENNIYIDNVELAGKTTTVINEEERELVVYPNPVIGNGVHINIPKPTEGESFVELYDVAGKRLIVKSIPSSSKSFYFDLPFFSPGIYFLHLVSVSKTRMSERLVITDGTF